MFITLQFLYVIMPQCPECGRTVTRLNENPDIVLSSATGVCADCEMVLAMSEYGTLQSNPEEPNKETF